WLVERVGIVLRQTALRESSGTRPRHSLATPLCLQNLVTGRAQTLVTQPAALHIAHGRQRRQQAAAQGAIGKAAQFQLSGHQMHLRLAAGEQVELLVRYDKLVGIQRPGGARHSELQKRAATIAESLQPEKAQRSGSSVGQTFSSMRA